MAVLAFSCPRFVSAANLVGIDGMEEDSAGLQLKEREHLPQCPLRRGFGESVRDAGTVMGYYDRPIRFEGSGK